MSRVLIEIYFGINIFCMGYCFADGLNWKTAGDKVVSVLWLIGILALGVPFLVLEICWIGLQKVWNVINGIFQLKFLYEYHFTKVWYNVQEYRLLQINRISNNIRNKNTIKDRIYRWCTGLINKRNNYIYNPDESKLNEGDVIL
jgi:hypothetical protein